MSPDLRTPDTVAGLVLAAGRSRRFGSAKQLALLDGRTLLEHVLHRAAEAGLDPILAVVPPWLELPKPATTITWVTNGEPDRGLSHSLRLGLAALPGTASAVVVLLGDQPTLDPAAIRAVVAARGERPVVAAFAAGHAAPPVLLERPAFALAEGLEGDVGLRDLISTHTELVRRVPVVAHAPDLDRPADLAALAGQSMPDRCPGCGAELPDDPRGPRHPYMTSSSGCWTAFGEVLAREFGSPDWFALHRLTVDTYAAQHPGGDDPRQRQSVALHLIALRHALDGVDARSLNAVTQRLAAEHREWPELSPPDGYPTTVADVLAARSADEHLALVHRWAQATWDAWGPHHARVEAWAREALAAQRDG